MNLMTYDLHGTWEDRTGCVAPLYTTEEDVQLAGGENFRGNFSGGFFVGFIPEFHLMGGNSGEFIEYIEKSWKIHHVC